jgi:ribonuclease P protein component
VRAREVKRVFDEGRAVHGMRVVMFLAPGQDRVAVIAGRKVGKAVQRNRARRVLRAAWRSVQPAAAGSDVVLVARAAIAGARTDDVVAELQALLGGRR